MRSIYELLTRSHLHSEPTPCGADVPAESVAVIKDDVYRRRISALRATEYSQLADICYLDNAASPPYPTSLITSIHQSLLQTLLSNPHSHSPSSIHTSKQINSTRSLILKNFFHVGPEDGWDLVFTSGTTAALKLVGEAFDWENAEFLCTKEAHTSLLGIRDLAQERGASSKVVQAANLIDALQSRGSRKTLIGLPLQCNATGQKQHRLLSSLMAFIQSHNFQDSHLILDVAAFLSTCQSLPLPSSSSSEYQSAPSFLAFSLYKIFGHPTGLGCLVIKRTALPMLLDRKSFFGGGTVEAITAGGMWKVKRKGVEGLEDGTANIHGIIGVQSALKVSKELFGEEEDQQRHVRWLSRHLFQRAASIKHGNGAALVKIYTRSADGRAWAQGKKLSDDDQAPTLNFNLINPSGMIIPPTEVDRLACVQNIHLRSGRHCNPGFITEQVGASEETIQRLWREGLGCDDAGSGGGEEGVSASLRVSLGVWSTTEDLDRFFGFLERFFVQPSQAMPGRHSTSGYGKAGRRLGEGYELKEMIVYPIKSCAGQTIPSHQPWPLEKTGLKHDREWVVVELATGKALSQKKYAKMTLIRPALDLAAGKMIVSVGLERFEVDIKPELGERNGGACSRNMELCGEVPNEAMQPVLSTDKDIQRILSDWLDVPCTLARQVVPGRHSKLGHGMGVEDRIPLLLSNESPFLLLNEDSVDKVTEWMHNEDGGRDQVAKAASFRGNFIIGRSSVSSPSSSIIDLEQPSNSRKHGQSPFVEDNISQLQIGPHTFAALGRCRRCQMVCIDQETGVHAPETYLCLSKRRRNERGRIEFGMHLMWRDDLESSGEGEVPAGLSVGMKIYMSFDDGTASDV